MSKTKRRLHRRGMLAARRAAASPGTLGADAQTGPGSSTHSSPSVDVLVIGGGLAGLATARALKDRGVNVLVLEARDRLGGRVHSQTLTDGVTIDLGAQFIGDRQTRISALVDEIGLTRVTPYADGFTAHLAGQGETPKFRNDERLPLSLMGQLDALQTVWRFDRELACFREQVERYDRMSASQFLASLSFSKNTADLISSHVATELCLPLDDVSAYEFLDQAASVGGFDGEQASARWFIAEGMTSVVQYLADGLGSSVMTRSGVSAIEPGGEGFVVTATSGVFRAERVVIAVPPQLYGRLGVLPLIAPANRSVIGRYRPGQSIKTMLVFEEPWWRHLGSSGGAMSQNDVFNAVVDGSPEDGCRGVLVMFSTACSAARLRRAGSEARRLQLARSWIADLAGASIPEPIAGRSIDWNADPFSRGGYASRRAKGDWSTTPELFVPSDGLFFVGTETADEWRSFMEGALQSAERATNAVLEDL